MISAECKVLLVGAGNIGLGYDLDGQGELISGQSKSHLGALLLNPKVTDITLVESDPVLSTWIEDRFPIRVHRTLSDVEEVYNLVIIAVPTPKHQSVITSILERTRANKLLLEKPIGINIQAFEEVKKYLVTLNSEIYVNYFRHFLPYALRLKGILSSVGLSRARSVDIFAYGSILNIYSHFLDLLLFIGIDLDSHTFAKIRKDDSAIKELVCSSCGFMITLRGVGEKKTSNSIRVEFEVASLIIFDFGYQLRVHESQQVYSFMESEEISLNYQSEVLESILNSNSEIQMSPDLLRAEKVQILINQLELSS